MVTRKPLPADAKAIVTPSSPNSAYPTSFSAEETSGYPGGYDGQPHSKYDAHETENAWASEAGHSRDDLPDTLHAEPPLLTPTSSEELQRPIPQSTNPYIRKQLSGQRTGDSGSSEGYADRPPLPSNPPPPPPIAKDEPPTNQFGNLGISEQHTNPWQNSLDSKPLPQHPPSYESQQPTKNEWQTEYPVPEKPPVLPPVNSTTPLIELSSPGEEESPAWDEPGYDDDSEEVVHELPGSSVQDADGEVEENAWADDSKGKEKEQDESTAKPIPSQDLLQEEDGWTDADAKPKESVIDSAQDPSNQMRALPPRNEVSEAIPNLPPRPQDGENQTMPSRPNADIASPRSSSIASPSVRPKTETYEIKKITWHDVTAKQNPRVTPILTQNANGPCPLLALVNALTLSTPAELNTALVETLRSREQVSLGLLLDAVFDELMSGRRGDAAQELPDVGDLYAFLLTLHTGMNVNPRFLPIPPDKNELRRSMSHVHPSEREDLLPGTFEETREMKLYSTFSVPLIHGWLPSKDSIQYSALKRSANSYEDAQNLMFREEELEEKLSMQGLSFEEQATLEDIATIRAYLSSSATQLTPYGLETITKSLKPGSVAILFRNDHFSTLYKHPDTYQLLQLVTDQGYAGHEEIVWESLVDVNGENCEFFSGDFRLVGGAGPSSARQSVDDSSGWTTVSSRRGNQAHHQPSTSMNSNRLSVDTNNRFVDVPPASPNNEQEDHDLALALQLQEEEEERHRAETERRRRETELSQQFIEQQASQEQQQQQQTGRGGRNRGSGSGPVNIAITNSNGRRNRAGRASTTNINPSSTNSSLPDSEEVRPAIPPRRNNAASAAQPAVAPIPGAGTDPEAGIDVPPPSYEAAAQQEPYVPPVDHPSHPSASTSAAPSISGRSGHGRRTSAYSANAAASSSAGMYGRPGPGVGLGPGGGAAAYRTASLGEPARRTASVGDERGKECVVM